MTTPRERLARLRRPRLLLRAARFGLDDYRRTATLIRLIARFGAQDQSPIQTQAQIVEALFAAESEAEAARKTGDAGYSPARHVALMTALMAELPALADRPQLVHSIAPEPASGTIAGGSPPSMVPAPPRPARGT